MIPPRFFLAPAHPGRPDPKLQSLRFRCGKPVVSLEDRWWKMVKSSLNHPIILMNLTIIIILKHQFHPISPHISPHFTIHFTTFHHISPHFTCYFTCYVMLITTAILISVDSPDPGRRPLDPGAHRKVGQRPWHHRGGWRWWSERNHGEFCLGNYPLVI